MPIETYDFEKDWLLDRAAPPQEVLIEFQETYAKLAREFRWAHLKPDCELFLLDKKMAEEAINYKDAGKILLNRKQCLIVDGIGAVLLEPTTILKEDVAAVGGLVYIHDPKSEKCFMASFAFGFTRQEDGPSDSQHFKVPQDEDGNYVLIDAFVLNKETKNYSALPSEHYHLLVKDIVHSVTIAIDQSFYLKDKTGHSAWDVPIFIPKKETTKSSVAREQRN